MTPWLVDITFILLAGILVALNGFFVAAEFALVKVRPNQLDELVRDGRPFAKTALWLAERLEPSLSVCQLGITMASLGLGWVGEPAFSHLLEPLLTGVGLTSPAVIHSVAFLVAFGTITALHLVIGEQAPKIFAIRRPQVMLLWCAAPMKLFYILSYPLMAALNWTTSLLLKRAGLQGTEHELPHSEDELRMLLQDAQVGGSISRAKHRLINAVFEFHDTICRRIMVPRREVVFFDVEQPLAECFAIARETKHTRYPVCEGSLDSVLGFIHMKDLIGVPADRSFNLRTILRPAQKVPENMPVTKVLKQFQASHQLLAFVVDEYGTVSGIVTLENVLEQIVGEVDDEFDTAERRIVSEGTGRWIIQGNAPVSEVRAQLKLDLEETDVDTFAGFLVTRAERMLSVGDRIAIAGAVAEVLEVQDDRATRIRVSLPPGEGESPTAGPSSPAKDDGTQTT